MSYYVKVLAGFIVLDLYLHVGIANANQFWLQILLILLFFPLLKGILIVTKVKAFKNIGITFHPKWIKNGMLGFAIGFSFWLALFAFQYLLNGFDIIEITPFPQLLVPLIMIMLTFLIGSFLNDIIVRGYVFGHLKGKVSLKWVFLISLVIYVLDDAWNEGFSLENMLFSLVLGLSLTYTIYKTGSIWATTGIHWGLNVCYGIFNGPLGSSGEGIVLIKNQSATFITQSISNIIPLLMFLFIILIRSKFEKIS